MHILPSLSSLKGRRKMESNRLEIGFGDYLVMYVRKSRQDNEFETVEEVLERHETQLQEFAIRLIGHRIAECDIYREVESAETIDERPKMKELLKRIYDPKCKGAIVIEPQRLTRGDLSELGAVVSAFRYTNTLILTPVKTFDLENKYDREFFERELIRGKDYIEYTKEILRRGREISLKAGNYIGSVAPFGYDRVKIGKSWTLAINEDEAQYVRMIYDLFLNKGYGFFRIARKLNEIGVKPRSSERFSDSSVRNILTNEVYIGKIRWNEKKTTRIYEDGKIKKKRVRCKDYDLYDGKHQPIIDESAFKEANSKIGNLTRENSRYEMSNMFSSLLKCGICHRALRFQKYNRRKVGNRYDCRQSVYCENTSIASDLVDKAIINELKNYLEDFKVLVNDGNEQEIARHHQMISRLEDDLIRLEKKQETLYDLLENGMYTREVFLMRNEALAKERESLKAKIKDAKAQVPDIRKNEHRYYTLMQALSAIEDPNVSVKAKNNLLKEIIEVIYYTRKVKGGDFEIEIILK